MRERRGEVTREKPLTSYLEGMENMRELSGRYKKRRGDHFDTVNTDRGQQDGIQMLRGERKTLEAYRRTVKRGCLLSHIS